MKINSGKSINNDNLLKSAQKKEETTKVISDDKYVASKEAAQGLKAYALRNQVNFGKRIEEHRSWGATVENTKSDGSQTVGFKVWAPNAARVVVEIRNPKDKISLTDKQRERYKLKDEWAGDWHVNADSNDGKSNFVTLNPGKDNIFTGKVDLPYSNGMYRYLLQDKDGNVISQTKDPVSKAQPHIFSWSQVYDEKSFKWTDGDWVAGKNSARVSDLARKPQAVLKRAGLSATGSDGKPLQKPSNLIVRQINIPTFTEEGSLEAAKKEIDKIAKDGIFNGILLMPVEGTYGENWGYDGVDKYAVSRGVAGKEGKENAIVRNNALKEFINYAHSKNINVGMDWVPSHIFKDGPTPDDAARLGLSACDGFRLSGNNLSDLGYYEVDGKWGGRGFNLESQIPSVRSNVRDYVVNMPMNWIENYHIDFIRADQTPEMQSNFAMKQVAQEVRYHFPHTVIHWEDHRTSDGLTRDLTNEELPYNNLSAHLDAISKTEADASSLHNIGGNEHWDFAFSHAIESILLNKEVMGFHPSIRTLADNIKDIGGTKYFMSHDEIGNDSGSRLMTKIIHKDLDINSHLLPKNDENPSQKHIRGLDTIQELFEAYEFDKKNWDKNFDLISKKNGLAGISKEQFADKIEYAKSKHKEAIGLLFMVPGSKMIFQGDAYGEINPFRFARMQSHDEKLLELQKGYDFKQAINQSKIDPEHHTIDGIHKLSQAMSDLVKRNPALQDVHPIDKLDAMTPLIDENNKLIAIKRFDNNGNEVVALYNFGDRPLENYHLYDSVSVLNDGTWKETINSNDTEFGGNGKYQNNSTYSSRMSVDLNIPSNGFIVLEKVNSQGKVINGTPKFN